MQRLHFRWNPAGFFFHFHVVLAESARFPLSKLDINSSHPHPYPQRFISISTRTHRGSSPSPPVPAKKSSHHIFWFMCQSTFNECVSLIILECLLYIAKEIKSRKTLLTCFLPLEAQPYAEFGFSIWGRLWRAR